MRILKLGVVGLDVEAWRKFLGIADSTVFDVAAEAATIRFQLQHPSLLADGVVGPATLAVAESLGFTFQDGYPPKPVGVSALSEAARAQIYGRFSFVADPTSNNPEGIKIIDGWDKQNITQLDVPQLAKLFGKPSFHVYCHVLAAKQFASLFADWEAAGLIDRIISFDGLWVPRFKRGSTTDLSNHSWGTAIDLNAIQNMQGHEPAALGSKGCLIELVDIAVKNGFFWGQWFNSRIDPMHFECFEVKS